MRTNVKRIKNILTSNFDLALTKPRFGDGVVAIFDEGLDTEHRVLIKLVGYSTKHEQGIHLSGLLDSKHDLEYHLVDAVTVALRDLFGTIYVHQAPKDTLELRERLATAVKKWIKAPHTEYQFNSVLKYYNADQVLESMDAAQLKLVLAAFSSAYSKAHEENRQKRREKRAQLNSKKAV